MNRRIFIRLLGAAAALVLAPLRAFAARPASAFDSTSKDDALAELYGTSTTVETGRITIKAPDIAENGAIVPVTVKFDIEHAESVSIISERNPAPLAASFVLSEPFRRARLDPDQDERDLSGACGGQGRRHGLPAPRRR